LPLVMQQPRMQQELEQAWSPPVLPGLNFSYSLPQTAAVQAPSEIYDETYRSLSAQIITFQKLIKASPQKTWKRGRMFAVSVLSLKHNCAFCTPPYLPRSLFYKDRRLFLHRRRFAHRQLVQAASQSYIVKCLIDIAEMLFERAKILKLARGDSRCHF
jgi:hypothetical protein